MYTPVFKKIRELLIPIILQYIGENLEVRGVDIGKHVKKLKERDPARFELIDFDYESWHSDQVAEVVYDMVLRCLVEETRRGYKLSAYGLSLISKDFGEASGEVELMGEFLRDLGDLPDNEQKNRLAEKWRGRLSLAVNRGRRRRLRRGADGDDSDPIGEAIRRLGV